jgi:hypothetical protein
VKNVPYYEQFAQGRRMRWLDAGHGFLAGRINDVIDENNFYLLDLDNNEWDVMAEGGEIMPMVRIEINEHVRMIGEKADDNQFYARRIMPAGPPIPEWFMDAPRSLDELHHPAQGMRPDDRPLPDDLQKMRDMIMHDMEIIGSECVGNSDCALPMMYAVRSNCPFEATCLNGECAVVCPDYQALPNEESGAIAPCAQNTDCDCAFYAGTDKAGCVCLNGTCGAVVAR